MTKTGLLVTTCVLSLAVYAAPAAAQGKAASSPVKAAHKAAPIKLAQVSPPAAQPIDPTQSTTPESPAETAAPGKVPETQSEGLGDIVVTAQRRTERLQDVPVSVTAFNPAVIEQLQLNDTLRTSKFVPGMISQHNAGLASANAFFLRGLGNTQSTPTFDAPVTTYVDDVYIARQNANNYAFFDTERVEVLRGPQGTLFGRNTTGGAVNVIMRKPLTTRRLQLEGTAGSYHRYTLKGIFDQPLSDKVLTKLSGFIIRDRGYLDNIITGEHLNGERSYGIRGDLRVLPTDNLTIDIAADWTVNNGSYGPMRHVPGTNPYVIFGTLSNTDTLARGLMDTDPIFYETASGLEKTTCGHNNIDKLLTTGKGNCNRSETFAITGRASWDIGPGAIDYIFGYRTLDQGYIVQYAVSSLTAPTTGFIIADNGVHEQQSHELKYNSDLFNERVHLVTGLFYLRETSDDRQTNVAGGLTPANVSVDQHLLHKVKTAAIYAQADFDATDQLTFTLGGRYTWEQKKVGFLASPEFPGLGYTTAAVEALGLPVKQTKKKVTPRIAVNYKINPDVMVFASVTNGFKSGGWNGNAPVPSQMIPFRPETTWSYESGIKSDFFNHKVRVNATGFFARTKDLQVTAGVINPITNQIQQLPFNAGTLKAYGLEIESNFIVTRGLSLFANPAFLRGKYTDVLPNRTVFTSDQCATLPAGIKCPTEPVRMPKFQIAAGALYETPVDALHGSISGSVAWRHNSPYWVAIANTTTTHTEDFVDGSIGWKSENEHTGIFFEVTNLFDDKTVTANFLSLFPGDPRRFTVRVKQRF